MKTTKRGKFFSRKPKCLLTRAIIVAGFLLCAINGLAQSPPGSKPSYPLDSWSFADTNNWTSDLGFAPVSFTNLDVSDLGDGTALVLDSTNAAWLQYNVVETNGTTNLTVDQGSIEFWFAPNWSSTNDAGGGLGPQVWGRLIEVGSYTPDSSYGWWSLYVDPAGANIYFAAQTNDGLGNTYMLSAPIDWTTNRWHFIALTYCATNTALYLDGQLATNGVGLSIWPGDDVLSNGFYIGSDSNGIAQAHGWFDNIDTYNVPLDSGTISGAFSYGAAPFYMNPANHGNFSSSPSNPSGSPTVYDAITGIGSLLWVSAATTCFSSTNVWITNVVASVAANGTMNFMFTIEGGSNALLYDIFAISELGFGTNYTWAWMGQGSQCNTYMLTNLPNAQCFLILGTPQDLDGDGLTDAYEILVSHTDPNNAYSNLDGLLDSWEVLLGLNPLTSNLNNSAMRSNYSYDMTDWLDGISGIRTGSVSLDNEGNVLTVSQ
jgi:hypothetical protein